MWDIRMHELLLPEPEQNRLVAQRARKQFVDKVVPTLEKLLGAEDVDHVCEPYHKGFTTADVMVTYSCWWADQYGLLEGSPVLQGYLKRMTSREHYKRACKAGRANKSRL